MGDRAPARVAPALLQQQSFRGTRPELSAGSAPENDSEAWSPEAVATGLSLAYSVVLNRFLPRRAYVPANLAAASLSLFLARRSGVPWADMGLRRDSLQRGFRVGLVAAVPVAVLVGLGAALPFGHGLFVPQSRLRSSGIAFESLVRIPLGTALPEEAIFRGALLGGSLARTSQREATAFSSLLFGLWHVLPTLDTLARNQSKGSGSMGKAGGVGGAVLVTTAAGFALARVRVTADSLVAPVVVHALTNALGFLAARLRERSS
jgi:membrane protease YdiL (CAAX protease family)